MGSCNSKNRRDLDPKSHHSERRRNSSRLITNKDSFVFDLVYENTNNIRKEYSIDPQVLGRGAFGEVRKAVHCATREVRAIKIIYKQGCPKEEQALIFDEIEILRTLDHPNIVKIFEYFEDERNIYIVMEFAVGKELYDSIIEVHHFRERDAVAVMAQLLSAVRYLHSRSIVHRDIKPENVMMDAQGVVKLVDFGTSKHFENNKKMTKIHGTAYYIAPEVLRQSYNEKCDVWSCGVILYVLLSGTPPFNGANDDEIMEAVSTGRYTFDCAEFKDVSRTAKSLISRMMAFNPAQRATAEQALKDVWFENSIERSTVSLSSDVVRNLRNFNVKTKMQQAVYFFMVNMMASKDEQRELLLAFHSLDSNGDGVLSRGELVAGLQQRGQFMSEAEIDQLIARVDSNKNKGIDYTEFVAAAIDKQKMLSEERILKCFKFFDSDNSGRISVEEFKRVFQGHNNVKDEVWRSLVKEVDENGDGEIDFSEFKNMLCRLLE